MKTAPPPADIAVRISEITNEIARIESAGPPLAQRIEAAEAELADARAFFARFGFGVVGVVPAERARNFRREIIGALMTIGAEALLAAERERIEAAHRAGGSLEFSADRLAELRASLRPLLAQRETAWRAEEAAGRGVDRSQFDPECFLASDSDLALAASGKEA
jgi:hypothetical protein